DDFGWLEEAIRLGDRPLAVDPLPLDVVEPGALRRQAAGHDANASVLSGRPVVSPDPAPDEGAGMPAGVVPNPQPRLLAFGRQFSAGPRKEGQRQLARISRSRAPLCGRTSGRDSQPTAWHVASRP